MSDLAEVTAPAGRLTGLSRDGVDTYLGIPFARPPVAHLRLRPPQPLPPWPGTRSARAFGPVAPQVSNKAPIQFLARRLGASLDEDCLYLNIWAPSGGGPRPVMVWLHGGGFFLGAGSRFLYSGHELARSGVVVVTLNYRLGALGFLDLGAATGAADMPANLGLRDQIAALEWVRDNICAFGGDPDQVTLFGESAGAMSGAVLMTLETSLFQRAILQSAVVDAVSTPDQAAEVASLFLEAVGEPDGEPERLRALPLETILAAQRVVLGESRRLGRLPWQPSIDGRLLLRPPLEAIAGGAGAEIDLVIGTNRDEWRLFTAGIPALRAMRSRKLESRVRRQLARRGLDPTRAAEVVDDYRKRSPRSRPTPFEIWTALRSDEAFRLPAVELATSHSGGRRRTFMYRFDLEIPALGRSLGACHAAELPLVFGTFHHPVLRPLYLGRPAVRRLSDRMRQAWVAFARCGEPASAGLPAWEPWSGEDRKCLILSSEPRLVSGLDDRMLALWNRLSSGSRRAASS